MIAGGASLAPRRWSWPAPAIDARSSPWCLWTAAMTAVAKKRNCRLSDGRVARVEQVVARVGAHRPVVVLARAVDAREGLLVQQADQVVAARHRLHHLHAEQLVVGADVRALEDRRHLVLGRGHLVVAGLDRHAELGQLELHLEHAGQHPLGDGAEVVVVQLVPLRRLGAEERAAGVDQVGTLVEEDLVDQEVLLLGPDGREDAARGVVAEQRERAQRGLAQRLHRAQQRDLRVQRLAGPRRERGRDAEVGAVRVLHDERRARRVPRGVAAGLEGRPDAARGEAGRVRLAPDELLPAELSPAPSRRRRGRRTSRASRPSTRSGAGTSACSASRPSRAPSPSSPSRPGRRAPGRGARPARWSSAGCGRPPSAGAGAGRRGRRRWRRRRRRRGRSGRRSRSTRSGSTGRRRRSSGELLAWRGRPSLSGRWQRRIVRMRRVPPTPTAGQTPMPIFRPVDKPRRWGARPA